MGDDLRDSGEVQLAGGESASVLLHRALLKAVEAHPTAFGRIGFPSTVDDFKRQYSLLLPRFEAARADSDERYEIAATLADEAQQAFAWRAESREEPLAERLAGRASPLRLTHEVFAGDGTLRPAVPNGEKVETGAELVAHARALVDRGSASESVAEGISWIVDHAGEDGIDLRGRRIVVLGAAAELAPTRLWLEGGADVLWIDVASPPDALLGNATLSGSLQWAEDGADLLRDPVRIRATVEQFAGSEGVDIGLYAYAPGRAREWRLTGAMNAIVNALPSAAIRSVTMLVSPTTPGVRTPAEIAGAERRRAQRAGWQAGLDRVGLLGRSPGHVQEGNTCANCGVVPIQGTSYQAAQYLGKLMTAETWRTADPPHHVSASMAGISRTRSLRHPVFDTAFGGAEAFGVETFEPATTAALNGLLTLRDWLDPASSTHPVAQSDAKPKRGNGQAPTRVHGGIYEHPYVLEKTLRVATAIGVIKEPRQIGALLRRS